MTSWWNAICFSKWTEECMTQIRRSSLCYCTWKMKQPLLSNKHFGLKRRTMKILEALHTSRKLWRMHSHWQAWPCCTWFMACLSSICHTSGTLHTLTTSAELAVFIHMNAPYTSSLNCTILDHRGTSNTPQSQALWPEISLLIISIQWPTFFIYCHHHSSSLTI